MPEIKVSVSTYNEIAAALEREGTKIGEGATRIILEKDTKITNPIDYRLATIRRDVADIASKTFKEGDFIKYVERLFNFVLKGEVVDETIKNPSTIQKDDAWK